MKTILVGVDFSKSSQNTINYAVELAKQTESRILLFHGLVTPAVHTISGLVFFEGKSLIKDAEQKITTLKAKLSKANPSVTFDCEVSYENIRERAKELASKNKISLAVIGLDTKKRISKFIYGTASVDISGKIDCPVITVPENYKHQILKKIIIAVDNKERISSGLSKRIHSFLKNMSAEAEYIHIMTEDELNLVGQKEYAFPVTNIKSKDFQTGISAYSKKSKADAILLISHNYNAFYSLFIESNSKKIIFSSKIPVTSIHK